MSTRSFHGEAQFQRVCAVCGSNGPFHAHHVIAKNRLKKIDRIDVLYDPRNALRLCQGLDGKQCHLEHYNRKLAIPTDRLKNQNICFIWEILKEAGQNLLERDYTGPEQRFRCHMEMGCPLCQL